MVPVDGGETPAAEASEGIELMSTDVRHGAKVTSAALCGTGDFSRDHL